MLIEKPQACWEPFGLAARIRALDAADFTAWVDVCGKQGETTAP